MDKSLINSRFREVVNLLLSRNLIKSKRELAEKLGISSTKLSEILAERMNVSAEIIGKMFTLFPDIPLNVYFYALKTSGKTKERMMDELWEFARQSKTNNSYSYQVEEYDNKDAASESAEVYKKRDDMGRILPLLPISAVAGWNGWEEAGVDYNECEKIDIGYLKKFNAEFCIRIAGNSMEPNYHNGDIIACRKLSESTFIQWGKVYLIDSEQGAMLKRVFPSTVEEMIECRSDNQDYPPFLLPKEEIRSLSVVVATVRVE